VDALIAPAVWHTRGPYYEKLGGAERDDKYAVQAERYPGFAEYQRKTLRTIPVVALTPTSGVKPRE
jgi:hypothetical protein